jgi:hypothetical protein
VGASRLSRIAAVQGISVGELLESQADKADDGKSPFRLLAGRDELRVFKAYSRIADPRLRRAIAELVEIAANQRTSGGSTPARKRRRNA